jgi:hypothetical protein
MIQPKYVGGLGFRDIELFNLAMLARQAWRILQKPESLSARLVKAIYFPESEFLEANLGSHPSQVWRSILEGHDALKLGLIRRIGDGKTTDAWKHGWLPCDERLLPVAAREANAPRLVSDYIDRTTATWNEEKLNRFFLPMDVDVIKGIPLCTRIQGDCWAWHFERSGFFSVRSAYRALVTTKRTREGRLDGRVASSN